MNKPTEAVKRPTGSWTWIFLQILSWVARHTGSLRLTVTLLGLSIVLVFIGTIAQVNAGIWTVVDQYFRCWVVKVGGWFPVFPGGWLLGTLLLIKDRKSTRLNSSHQLISYA